MALDSMDLERAREFFELRFFSLLATAKHGALWIRAGGSVTLTAGSAGDRPVTDMCATPLNIGTNT